MASSRLHKLVVLWAAAWFSLALPAHPRGAVRIADDSGSRVVCAPRSCCPKNQAPSDSGSSEKRDPVRTCAICKLIAKLDLPAGVIFLWHDQGRVDLLPALPRTFLAAHDTWPPLYGHAPPA